MTIEPTITICSDAGHAKFYKQYIATWACYIRTPAQTIKQSGVLKEQVENSMWAEKMGIANALFLADSSADLSKFRVIVYCDNLKALQSKTSMRHTEKSKHYTKERREYDFHMRFIQPYIDKAKSYEVRHVKGHLQVSKWSKISKRNYMNNWCDVEAKRLMHLERDRILKSVRAL